jgi:predicted transcriptional regulator
MSENVMACIDPDGFLTITAIFLLRNLAEQSLPPEEIAKRLGEPVFKVRANLREMLEAGLIQEEGGLYHLTEEGRSKI